MEQEDTQQRLAANDGKLWVTWSMSHLGLAMARVRVHRADGTVEREFSKLQGRYYQKLAWGLDGLLYAIEQRDLVKVVDGAPVLVAKLGKLRYGDEPNAVGVAPGIVQLLPLDAKTLLVVPLSGTPIVVRNGVAQRL